MFRRNSLRAEGAPVIPAQGAAVFRSQSENCGALGSRAGTDQRAESPTQSAPDIHNG
jgi:hypothetical protein